MTFAGSFYRSFLYRTNPYLVPLRNRRLARLATRDAAAIQRQVNAAIDSAIRYFETRPHINLAPFIMLIRLARTGLVPRIQAFEQAVSGYFEKYSHPHLRLLDPQYAPPEDPSATDADDHYDNPVHQLMTRCLYADRRGDGASCLAELAKLDDGGGYGSTHIVVGALILREFGAVPEALIEPLLRPVSGGLIDAQRCDRAGDLFAERIATLQWLGRDAAVEPAWILRLLKAQCRDGGWTAGPSLRFAAPNHHTTVLALIALVQWKAGVSLQGPSHENPNASPLRLPFWRKARQL